MPLGRMIVLRVGHALCHDAAISDSFSDESEPGAMNVRYRSDLKCANDAAVSSNNACTSVSPHVRINGREKKKETCMGRLSYKDDGVERFERGQTRCDFGDEYRGGSDVERHDGEATEWAGGEEEGVERGGGVAGVERHGDALDGTTADKVGGEVWGGEHGAKVCETREGFRGEREGVDGVETSEADFDDVVLGFEEAGEEGFAAHRGGETFEGKGASLEDPCEVGGDVGGREIETEVRKVVESLQRTLEEAEKVGCEGILGPFKLESTDER